jgi:hypothetical protein
MTVPITEHEGKKYLRTIRSADQEGVSIRIDVYAVIEAFGITCSARAHAVKKLLCAGTRGKGTDIQDLEGVIASTHRAVELQKARNANPSLSPTKP